jgi:general secretion pathway protein M
MKQYLQKLTVLKSLTLPLKLQKRERMLVSAGAVVVVILIFLQFFLFPIFDRRTRLQKEILNNKVAMQEMVALKAEASAAANNVQLTEKQLKQRPSGFTLFSFLDTLAGKTGIKQNITYMKPTSTNIKNSPYALSMVEMKLQSVTMEQLVNYLNGVENAPQQIWIKRISITKGEKNESLLTSILQVETYQL